MPSYTGHTCSPTYVPCLTVPWAFLMLLIFAAPSNRAKDLDEGWVKMPTLGVANVLLLCTVYMGVCVCETVRVCALSVHRRQPKNVQKMGVARRDISNGIVSRCCRVSMCCCCLMHVGKCQNDVPTTPSIRSPLSLRHLQLLMAEN